MKNITVRLHLSSCHAIISVEGIICSKKNFHTACYSRVDLLSAPRFGLPLRMCRHHVYVSSFSFTLTRPKHTHEKLCFRDNIILYEQYLRFLYSLTMFYFWHNNLNIRRPICITMITGL